MLRVGNGSRRFAGLLGSKQRRPGQPYERMVSVFENAPEWAGQVPAEEWSSERDAHRIARMLDESGKRVRDAVKGRVEADRSLDRDFAHPIQLLQFLIFHEGYHHGQIKLALKAAGCPIADADR